MKRRVLLTSLLLAGYALAQDAPAPRLPGQPQREPFLKDRGAPSAAPDNTGLITSMTTVYEVFALPEGEANALLTAPADNAARYRRLNDLLQQGKARLESVQALANRSAARAAVDAQDTVQVPQDYLRAGETLVPSMGSMSVGEHLEMEVNLAPDTRSANLNVSLETGDSFGFREFRMTAKDAFGPQGLLVEKSNITTSLPLRTGEPILLGSLSRSPTAPDRPSESRLAFVRVLVNHDRPEGVEPAAGAVGYVEQTLWVYSLDRATARTLLTAGHKPGELYANVADLGKKGQAKLEHTVLLSAQTGVKAGSSENQVLRVPGWALPATGDSTPAARRPAGAGQEPLAPTALISTKMPGLNLGFAADIGCEVGPPDALLKGLPLTADLFVDVWWRADRGKMQQDGATLQNPEREVIEVRRMNSYLRCYTDVPTFVGTINPPRQTGLNSRRDDGRAWLCFVRLSPVRP